MLPSLLVLSAVIAQAPIDEPVWIGTEAARTVKLNDPNVEPNRPSGQSDRNRVSPLILTAVNPVGKDPKSDAWIYEIRYVGLQAGEHDLRDYLSFSPEVNRQMFAPILVSVADPLPLDHHGQLETPPVLARAGRAPSAPSRAFAAALAVWLAGLGLAGIAACKKWRSRRVMVPAGAKEDALLKRLRLAEVKRLTPQGVAELERELLDRWRRELSLDDSRGVALIRALEKDGRGQALLTALEAWRSRLESSPAPMPAVLKDWAERNTSSPVPEAAAP